MFHPTSFRRDECGNISILFAISAMVLLLVSGGAINFSDAIRIRQGLQAAADAAVLHGAVLDDAHHAGLSATERAERRVDGVRTLLTSNLAGVLGSEAHATAQSADIAIDAQTGEVLLTLSYDYQPPVPIEHFSEAQPLSVTASADARQSATRDVSIVFVLDVSSSMSKRRAATSRASTRSRTRRAPCSAPSPPRRRMRAAPATPSARPWSPMTAPW